MATKKATAKRKAVGSSRSNKSWLSSTKSRLLTVAVLFGFVGLVYFLYQTFALSNTVHYWGSLTTANQSVTYKITTGKGPLHVSFSNNTADLVLGITDSKGNFVGSVKSIGRTDVVFDATVQPDTYTFKLALPDGKKFSGKKGYSFYITYPVQDLQIPTAVITKPLDQEVVSGEADFNANALDNDSVEKVEFYVDGALLGTDTSAPYGVKWDTTKVTNAKHTLSVKSYDPAGNVGNAQGVATVDNGKQTMGGVLLGSNQPDNSDANYTEAEAQLGRKLDSVRIFHSKWSTDFSKELSYANKGKIVETSYKLWGSWKQVSDDLRTPNSPRRLEVEKMAQDMQSKMPGPHFLVLNHEPENDVNASAGQSEQDYGDMVCAFHDLFRMKGNTKTKFTVAAIRENYNSDVSLGAKLYPGDQCLDWNGADSYNFFTDEKVSNWRTFTQGMKNQNNDGTQRKATGWYQFATTDFTGKPCTIMNNPTCYGNVRHLDGKVEPKQAKGKLPIIIGEWGTVEYYPCLSTNCNTPHGGDPAKKAAWFKQGLADLKNDLPQVKILNHWGTISVSSKASFHCFGNDTRFNTTLPSSMSCATSLSSVPTSYSGTSFQAFRAISLDPFVYITKGLDDGTASSAAAQKRFDFVNSFD